MNNGVSYALGLDVSTKTIGVTLMDLSGKLIDISYISMPKKSKKNGDVSIYKKVDFFVENIKRFKEYNVKHIFIEEPLKNGPNIGTTIILAKFNGMISQKLYEIFGFEPQHLTVHQSRSLFFPEYIVTKKVKDEVKETLSFPKDADKKKLVFDKVSYNEPQVIWVYDKHFRLKEENFDMADSYVVTKAGLQVNEYI